MGFRLLIVFLVFLLQVPLSPRQSCASPLPSPSLLPGFPLIAGEKVLIVWSPVPGAVSYKVYKDGLFLESTAASSYSGTLPASGDAVRFQVSAVSGTGEESRLSAPGVLQLARVAAPADVGISVSPDQPAVVLVWTTVREAFAYNVYRNAGEGQFALLHSGVDTFFRDQEVRKDSRYGYAIAAVDRYGREGERSRPRIVEIPAGPRPERGVRATAVRRSATGAGATGKKSKTGENVRSPLDAAFREVLSIGKINDVPLGEVSFLGLGGDNVLRVVRPGVREIDAIDRTGEVTTILGPANLDLAGVGFVPHKIGVGPDGRLVVSDVMHGTVACFDRQGGLVWSRKIDRPPAEEKLVWEGFPADYGTLPVSPSSVLVLPGEILVSDQRLQLIYRLGPEGGLRGYITHYRKGEDSWRLRRVGEMEAVPGRGVLLTFPLVRKAMLVDGEFAAISEIAGSGKDPAAGFRGLHGVQFIPGEGILLTDPTGGTIKMFDPETGEHLRDLKTPMFWNPNMAVWERGERIWVYLAREKRIAVLAPDAAGK